MHINMNHHPDFRPFAKEILNLVRFSGKTNFILKREIEELIVRHNVSLRNLEGERK